MVSSAAQQRDAAEEEVTDALLGLSRVFVGMAAQSLAVMDEDVTLPQFRVLILLVSRGPQRVVDVAKEFAVQSSTATRLCDRLVRKGLASRRERAEDRRAVWLELTPAGRDLVGSAMRHRRDTIAALVAEVSMTRPLAFASVLHALVEAAGEVPGRLWWDRLQTSVTDGVPVDTMG